VIVCDGFIGNVALKVSEGLVDIVKHLLQESLKATITRRIGYVLARAAFADFKKRVDYSESGGAPLLGVRGVCVVCHGQSNPNAIKNAIRVASELASAAVDREIETEMARFVPCAVAAKAD
jgi:glycerol-3-phosphate acyltransferase PlsX